MALGEELPIAVVGPCQEFGPRPNGPAVVQEFLGAVNQVPDGSHRKDLIIRSFAGSLCLVGAHHLLSEVGTARIARRPTLCKLRLGLEKLDQSLDKLLRVHFAEDGAANGGDFLGDIVR
jgi:hypothetical protein